MNIVTEEQAKVFVERWKQIIMRTKVTRQCRATPPKHIKWFVDCVYLDEWSSAVLKQKSKYWLPYRPGRISVEEMQDASIARVSRTFVLLDDIEEWLDRLDAGIARHEAELERQAASAITRFQTAVAMR